MVSHTFLHRWAHLVLLLVSFLFLFPSIIQAQEPAEHHTVIINQVRGGECCGAGGTNELRDQITAGRELDLPLTFTVRYDALRDPEYQNLLIQALDSGMEIGGFLEITPELASASGVMYHGTEDTWYEAQHVYLIGYAPEDRIKLIETYMNTFEDVFGGYPTTTTAWIIDTPSLKLLHETYGVEVHQITREQWGTDSYTMWGGPPHFPYFPSEEWAFVPTASDSGTMPVIVRQTISDPVWNYGDTTNSHTSQPNDYRLGNRGFPYFQHLFLQAHNQVSQPFTFALLGLENSMPEIDQLEFRQQLNFVAEWNDSQGNTVLSARDFAERMRGSALAPITLHAGAGNETGDADQAWWITTPAYRARLRYNNETLYLSDIRIYDAGLQDPYTTRQAEKLAYWVTPFVLDGARFWENDTSRTFHSPHTDQLTPRKSEYDMPTRLVLAEEVAPESIQLHQENATWHLTVNDTPIARFATEHWTTHTPTSHFNTPLSELLTDWRWTDTTGNFTWGFTITDATTPQVTEYSKSWYPFIHPAALEQERIERYPYLYPEVQERPLDLEKTTLTVTNAFARAGRNPIRLAFFPRDSYGYPTYISEDPTITVHSDSIHTNLTQPSSHNGLVFIDLTSGEVQKATVTVEYQDYMSTHEVVFAPDCTDQWRSCLQKPHYWWWYFRNWAGDTYRQWQENAAN